MAGILQRVRSVSVPAGDHGGEENILSTCPLFGRALPRLRAGAAATLTKRTKKCNPPACKRLARPMQHAKRKR
ncbi:hypothetical protein GCM10009099_02570 [Caenispirillum bisanense]